MKDRFFNNLQTFCAAYCLVWLFGGVMDFFSFLPRISVYILFALWFMTAVFSKPLFVNRLLKTGWPLYLLFFVNTIIVLQKSELYFSNIETTFMYICVVHAMLIYYSTASEKPKRKVLFWIMIADIVIISIFTFRALQIDPNIARFLSAGIDRYSQIVDSRKIVGETAIPVSSIKAVGSYGFFNSYIFILMLLITAWTNLKKGWKKVLAFVLTISSFIMCFEASFVIVSIISVIAILVILLNKKISNKRERLCIYLFILLVFMVLCITQAIPTILDDITSGIQNVTFKSRLNEIANVFRGNFNVASGDLGSRVSLYSQSVRYFFSHPFTGCMFSKVSGNVGGHSTGLDMFAAYGFLGSLFVVFIAKTSKYIRTNYFGKSPFVLKIATWCLFLLLFVNSLLSVQIYIAFMIILPFGMELICSATETGTDTASAVLKEGNPGR